MCRWEWGLYHMTSGGAWRSRNYCPLIVQQEGDSNGRQKALHNSFRSSKPDSGELVCCARHRSRSMIGYISMIQLYPFWSQATCHRTKFLWNNAYLQVGSHFKVLSITARSFTRTRPPHDSNRKCFISSLFTHRRQSMNPRIWLYTNKIKMGAYSWRKSILHCRSCPKRINVI